MKSESVKKWGVLGTGRMARSFASAMPHVKNGEISAVASRQKTRAAAFAKEFNIDRHFSGYEALVADDDVDIVYIATPHAMHERDMRMCIEAGKPVLCEKPFTINAGEAERVIAHAAGQNVFLMEAMWTRYLPALRRLREILDEQLLGDVQFMLAGGAFMPDYDPDNYLFDPQLGGGVLLDAGVYLVSMASMLFGKPLSIRALAGKGKSGVDEHDAVILEHGSGALASLYVSLRGQSSPDMTLLGSRGRIYLHPPIFAPRKITLEFYGSKAQEIDLGFAGNGYQFEIEEAQRCLENGQRESTWMPLDESLQIMQTMDEIRKQIHLVYPMEAL